MFNNYTNIIFIVHPYVREYNSSYSQNFTKFLHSVRIDKNGVRVDFKSL